MNAQTLTDAAAAQRIARANRQAEQAAGDADYATVTYRCRHEGEIDVTAYRDLPTKRAREVTRASRMICPACYREEKDFEVQTWENAAGQIGRLAPLLGTAKQIGLAQSVRMQAIVALRAATPPDLGKDAAAAWERFETAAMACPTADVWCEMSQIVIGREPAPGGYRHPILYVIVCAAQEYAASQAGLAGFAPLPPHPYE